MIAVISPAKSLELSREIDCQMISEPIFDIEKSPIVAKLKKMKPLQIASTYAISQKLAELNYERFQSLGSKESLTKRRQAAFCFDGEVYQGLNTYTIDKKNIPYLQNHLRILSGLYGILRPCDIIEPYRLEMGIKISIGPSKNLYQFWTKRVTNSLKEELALSDSKTLVNLASNEYSKVIDRKALSARVLEVDFLEKDKSEFKSISFFSKKARGLVARYLVDNQIKHAEDIKEFDYERYAFDSKLSTKDKYVFTRKYQLKGK